MDTDHAGNPQSATHHRQSPLKKNIICSYLLQQGLGVVFLTLQRIIKMNESLSCPLTHIGHYLTDISDVTTHQQIPG